MRSVEEITNEIEQVIQYHDDMHEAISKDYYEHKLITKQQFDQLHGDNWTNKSLELMRLRLELRETS